MKYLLLWFILLLIKDMSHNKQLHGFDGIDSNAQLSCKDKIF